MAIRLDVIPLRVCALLTIWGCSKQATLNDPVVLDGSAVIYGRILSTSGIVVPNATAIVQFYADTIRENSYYVHCGGELKATASQQLDAQGDYRIEVVVPGGAGQKVCVEVTGDPHGLYSDIGLMKKYGGWITPMNASGNAAPPELLVDVRYAEMP